MGGNQILVLPESALRYKGRDAQRTNIDAARVISQAIRTTLGPRGMDKMLVDSMGDVVITNDGVTILEEMEVEHPAAKIIIEIAKTQENEVGDGTTTAVAIGGALLEESEDLLDQGVHASIIALGYKKASEKAREILDEMAISVSPDDEEVLLDIISTTLGSKGSEVRGENLEKICVKAVKQIIDEEGDKIIADIDNIKVEKKTGGSIDDSQLVDGIVIDKERVHPGMPNRVEDAKIALLDTALEIKETETKAEVQITSPEQLKSFLDEEEGMLKEIVDHLQDVGANVVLCQKGIGDIAQHFLSKAGILAVKSVKKSDMKKLARATGGRISSNYKDLSKEDLGRANLVEERKISGEEMLFIEGCENPKAVSLLIKGGTEHVVDEAERAVHDGLSVISAAFEDGKFVPGGGAPEIEIAKGVREYAASVGGREALAINAFADAIEVIPKTLAENAGLDPVDILVELRAAHDKKNGNRRGINVLSGKVEDMVKTGIVEPLRIKTQAVGSATDAAEMILRIDDVISAKGLGKEESGEMGM
ncbi:MAG: TCP-1/cpn60 chaperonin family protein [Hadesarchaea archaeon]|nr:TCP-1/cpn60 chaperonin family protein [Hadesarchaea archaeon]